MKIENITQKLYMCENTSYPINLKRKHNKPDKIDYIEGGKVPHTKIY